MKGAYELFKEGKIAFQGGYKIHSCPYTGSSYERKTWLEGWRDEFVKELKPSDKVCIMARRDWFSQ